MGYPPFLISTVVDGCAKVHDGFGGYPPFLISTVVDVIGGPGVTNGYPPLSNFYCCRYDVIAHTGVVGGYPPLF